MLEFVSFLLSLLLLQPVLGYRPVIHPKEKETTSEEPKPWIRTVYSTKVEIVTPTVIAGVTFSAKPLATPDPLQPWVSLQKDGRPKLSSLKSRMGIPERVALIIPPTSRPPPFTNTLMMN